MRTYGQGCTYRTTGRILLVSSLPTTVSTGRAARQRLARPQPRKAARTRPKVQDHLQPRSKRWTYLLLQPPVAPSLANPFGNALPFNQGCSRVGEYRASDSRHDQLLPCLARCVCGAAELASVAGRSSSCLYQFLVLAAVRCRSVCSALPFVSTRSLFGYSVVL